MKFRSWLGALRRGPSRRPIRRSESPGPRRKAAVGNLSFDDLEGRFVPAFLSPVDYPAGSYPTAPIAGYFNNDSVLDLAVANSYGNTVSVFLGNGDGTFQAALNSSTGDYPLGSYPFGLDAADLNGDGKRDLVTTNAYGLSVLLGNGDGTFQAPGNIDVGLYPNSVAVGDFDGDHKMDLGVVTNTYYGYGYGGYYESRVKVLLGNGDGTFGAPTTVVDDFTYRAGAAAADLNGDGKDDLVTTDNSSGAVEVLLGSSSGLQAPTNYPTNPGPWDVQVHDVNGDGIGDLMTNNGGSVSVLLGNGSGGTGDGTFQAPVTTKLGFSAGSVAVGDFNADGKMDLAGTSNQYIIDGYKGYWGYYGYYYRPYGHYEGQANVLLGHGNGHFSDVGTTDLGYGYVTGVASGDFNAGGFSDLAVTNYDTNNLSVSLNDESWPPVPPPSLSINDATVTEGNSGSTNATFTVSLEFAADQDVVVHYSTADGTATTAGGDYTGVTNGTVTIPKGQTSATFNIAVLGDRVGESDETFSASISSSDAPVADGTGIGTILDDEPRISINDAPAVTEGNTGGKNATFTVTLSRTYDQDVVVHYSTADGTATTAGGDYTGVTDATVTVPKGQTQATFNITVLGDRTAESNEGFTVNLSGATNSFISDGSGAGTIIDDEPRITIGDVSKKEGTANGGKNAVTTTAFVFTISLSAAYDQDVTVHYSTANGSATASSDYTAVTNQLATIRAGQTSVTITILVNADKTKESDEWFAVNLSNQSSNATISDSQGIGWILDDDTHGNGKP